jgi:hypothetical protein
VPAVKSSPDGLPPLLLSQVVVLDVFDAARTTSMTVPSRYSTTATILPSSDLFGTRGPTWRFASSFNEGLNVEQSAKQTCVEHVDDSTRDASRSEASLHLPADHYVSQIGGGQRYFSRTGLKREAFV